MEGVLNMEKKHIKIYQTKRWCKYAFENYEWAKQNGFNLEDYDVVAEFYKEVYEPDWRVLESIFDLGNRGYIQAVCNNEFMRSISVSDIIEINDKKYYVDSFGFKEVE